METKKINVSDLIVGGLFGAMVGMMLAYTVTSLARGDVKRELIRLSCTEWEPSNQGNEHLSIVIGPLEPVSGYNAGPVSEKIVGPRMKMKASFECSGSLQ